MHWLKQVLLYKNLPEIQEVQFVENKEQVKQLELHV